MKKIKCTNYLCKFSKNEICIKKETLAFKIINEDEEWGKNGWLICDSFIIREEISEDYKDQ